MIHPDIQDAIYELTSQLVDTDHVYDRLQPNFTDDLPAVLIRAEQNDGEDLATHRVQLEVYHQDMPSCRQLARTLLAHLTNGPHATTVGLIDDVRIETHLREVPYPNPAVVMYTASIFVDTRAI